MSSRSEIDKRRKKVRKKVRNPVKAKKVKTKKAKKVKKPSVKRAKKLVKAKKSVAKKTKKSVAKKAKKSVTKKAKKSVTKKVKKPVVKVAVPAERQMRWLSIAVAEGNEIQVAKFIGRIKGVAQVLLPLHDGSALYPGYAFSECDFSDDILMDICQLADVEGILSKDGICNYAAGGHGVPAELEAESLCSIRESESRYARLVRNEMTIVEKGQEIAITSGVFSGMSGHVISVNRRKMSVIAKIRLSDGGMIRKVSVKYGQFEIMDGESDDGWRL